MTEIARAIAFRPSVVIVVRPRARRTTSQKSHAKRAVLSLLLGYLAISAVLAVKMDGSLSRIRDPEFGARRDRLVARIAEHPNRPLILVLGSSRTVEGIRPDAVNGDRGSMLFNGGLMGSGPMMEVMSYRRLKAAGCKPSAVVLEYWPPMLRGDAHAEYGRIGLPRLGPRDWPMVRDYYPDPPSVMRYLAEGQLWPAWRYRRSLLAAVRPHWVPGVKDDQRFARGIDGWGWWAGLARDSIDEHRRLYGFEHYKSFAPMLDRYSVGGPADRALRDLLAECRADGVAVAFVYMPEGPTFRTLYSADADRAWRTHLDTVSSEYAVPVLDARTWDEFAPDLPDQVHLTREGAARFTHRLVADLPRLFPGLAGAAP